MDNTPYLLDNSLTTGIVDWFNTNTYFDGFFKVIYNYNRIDIPQSELTGVNVYLLPTNTRQKPPKVLGKVAIDVCFSIAEQREQKFLQLYRTLNTIRAQLLYNPNYIQKYLSTNWTPGLQFIQSQNDINFATLRTSLLKKDGTVTVPITLDYQVDILLNQRALWKAGYDFYSPAEEIYFDIDEIEVDITTEPYQN